MSFTTQITSNDPNITSSLVLSLCQQNEEEKNATELAIAGAIREMMGKQQWMQSKLEDQEAKIRNLEAAEGVAPRIYTELQPFSSVQLINVHRIVSAILQNGETLYDETLIGTLSQQLQREREETILVIAEYVQGLIEQQKGMFDKLRECEQRITQLEQMAEQRKIRIENERQQQLLSTPYRDATWNLITSQHAIINISNGTYRPVGGIYPTKQGPSSVLYPFEPTPWFDARGEMSYKYAIIPDRSLLPYFENAKIKSIEIIQAYKQAGQYLTEWPYDDLTEWPKYETSLEWLKG